MKDATKNALFSLESEEYNCPWQTSSALPETEERASQIKMCLSVHYLELQPHTILKIKLIFRKLSK